MGDLLSCSEVLGCDGVCESDGGPGTPGYLDECGVCGGLGYNAGGCCGNDSNCLSYADMQLIFSTSYNSSTKCISCHGSSGSFDLTTHADLMIGGSQGPVVIPFESENSHLILKLNSPPPFNSQMPQGGPYLDASIISQIATWIDQGAIESPGNSQ